LKKLDLTEDQLIILWKVVTINRQKKLWIIFWRFTKICRLFFFFI